MGLLCPGAANDDTYELEEGEWIPDDSHDAIDSSGSVFDEGLCYHDSYNQLTGFSHHSPV